MGMQENWNNRLQGLTFKTKSAQNKQSKNNPINFFPVLLVTDLILLWLNLTFPNHFDFLPLGGSAANQIVSLVLLSIIICCICDIFNVGPRK